MWYKNGSVLKNGIIVLKCDHYFCKKCIEKKIEEAEKANGLIAIRKVECPNCNIEINPSEDMKAPHLFMRNQMSLIKLKCALPGCTEIIPYDIFQAHIAECTFNPDKKVKCKHCNDAVF